jgi:hypothetical protein
LGWNLAKVADITYKTNSNKAGWLIVLSFNSLESPTPTTGSLNALCCRPNLPGPDLSSEKV